ncbi:hypothetical protein [Niveispirillum sp. KHB5.9]|uniref:hypothetical protein n=1 Tax=Niveispirillum sp. KHB5.9 TaxID=3400269 RepID=UPI003A866FBA
MRYREVIDAAALSILARKIADLRGTSKAEISKEVTIRKTDHAKACHFLSEECGVTPIDINSMCPQFVQVVFDNIKDQILFLKSCPHGDLTGTEYVVEKEVCPQIYREIWASFLEILDRHAYFGRIKLRHVLRMQVRTFTEAEMKEFERRFAITC